MIRQLYIDHNHITLLVTLLCMVNTPESPHCRPVLVCHIRLPHFAAAIKCRTLVSGIGYSTVPYFSPLGRFWYSSLTPSNYSISNERYPQYRNKVFIFNYNMAITINISTLLHKTCIILNIIWFSALGNVWMHRTHHGVMITGGLIRKRGLSMTSSQGTAHKKIK